LPHWIESGHPFELALVKSPDSPSVFQGPFKGVFKEVTKCPAGKVALELVPFTFRDERKTIKDELIFSANVSFKETADKLLVSEPPAECLLGSPRTLTTPGLKFLRDLVKGTKSLIAILFPIGSC